MAASLAALGRQKEAAAVVTEALARYPHLSIEEYVANPGWSAAERERLTETMKKAGFPVCAGEETLKEYSTMLRLPECLQS